jgi:RND family efflux transporter MFP subunit
VGQELVGFGQVQGVLPTRVKMALAAALLAGVGGCRQATPPAAPPPQALPVMVSPVSLNSVPTGDVYVATVKSRRSATISPQVDGNITKIFVVSGQAVKQGQVLMQIDPLRQTAAVQQQAGSEAQAKAGYSFNQGELDRQKKLYEAGITSKQAYDTATQNFESSKAAYTASAAGTSSQRAQLSYYQIRAPFAGVVGDIPVHVGDYVTPNGVPSTVLTTVDDPSGLEAYVYVPTERAAEVKMGLPVEILDTTGNVLAKSQVSFISPEVDNGVQGLLVKASIPSGAKVRNQQVVNARVTWSTSPKPTVPVLAVTQIGGQSFVYLAVPRGAGFMAHQVPVSVGDTLGNVYPVLKGLKPGDDVIVSGLQFIGEGAPVTPMKGAPGAPKS